jgi:hypothetical protein
MIGLPFEPIPMFDVVGFSGKALSGRPVHVMRLPKI